MKKTLISISLVLAVAVSACGASEDTSGTKTSREPKPPKTWPALQRAARHEGATRAVVPHGPPPEKVAVHDLVEGNGPRIRRTAWFLISYIAFRYDGREVFEDKRDADAWNWHWGSGELSKGWEIGLRGLKVGGVRELVVPSRLAYGSGAIVYILKLRALADLPEVS